MNLRISRSAPINKTFLLFIDSAEDTFAEIKVFPSPLTDEVTRITVALLGTILSLITEKLRLAISILMLSANGFLVFESINCKLNP